MFSFSFSAALRSWWETSPGNSTKMKNPLHFCIFINTILKIQGLTANHQHTKSATGAADMDPKCEKSKIILILFVFSPSSPIYLRTSPGCERCPQPAGTAPPPAWPQSCRWLKNGEKKGKKGEKTGYSKAGEGLGKGR